MGDMGDDFRAMRSHTQRVHATWNRINTKAIKKSGIPYLDRGETFCFREEGKPKVDFYPSTGRWREVGTSERKPTLRGGAKAFLGWYRKQIREETP